MSRSLPSVLSQTFKDFEVIVIDDCSDEPYFNGISGSVILGKIRYHRNTERKGLAYGRNLGVRMAKGDYIVSLDDDNLFEPQFLEKTVAYLDSHPVDAVGVRKVIVYPEGKCSMLPKLPCSLNDGFVFRKEVFEKIRCDEELHANEDADLGIQFFKAGLKMGLIDEPLMTVYGSPIFNTTSYSDYSDRHLDGLAKFWLKNHDYKQYIGRMFLLSSGHWFRYFYWIEQKLKRWYQIYL